MEGGGRGRVYGGLVSAQASTNILDGSDGSQSYGMAKGFLNNAPAAEISRASSDPVNREFFHALAPTGGGPGGGGVAGGGGAEG